MIWPDKRVRVPLPVDDKLPEILALLKEHPVLICEAETGAGKTTRIAQAIILSNPELKVWMTQPRRNACRWIGQRIAAELGTTPGQLVGWRLLNEAPVYSATTRLELMIDRSLINRILNTPILPAGVIIIDEAHERSIDIDFLLALIKEKLPSSPNTRVIVTSATIDTKKFSDFFNNAPILTIAGRCFPVSVEVFNLSQGEHHTEGAIRAARQTLRQFLGDQLFIFDENKIKRTVNMGNVLILLPGKEDITAATRALGEEVQRLGAAGRVEVLSCHGESTSAEQDQVQKSLSQNTLRLICCTELLRSSVTVPETIGVIDSLQVKRLVTNEHGIASLEKVPVSKAEADQAKGRAGRTGPGFYIPISFEYQYQQLAPWPQPAILRESLTHLILQIASINRSARTFNLIDRPGSKEIEAATARLIMLGALTAEETITENGKLLLDFPLPPELAMILLTANRLNVLDEAIIVTAALDIEGFFQAPKKESTLIADKTLLDAIWSDDGKNETLPNWVQKRGANFEIQCNHPNFPDKNGAKWISDKLHQQWAEGSKSDFTVIVRAYRAVQLEEERSMPRPRAPRSAFAAQEHHLNNWCYAHGVNLKKYQLVKEKIAQIQSSWPKSMVRKDRSRPLYEFDDIALTKAIFSGKLDQIAQYRPSAASFKGSIGEFNIDYGSVCPNVASLVLVANLRKIHVPGRRGYGPTYKNIASYAAAIDPAWLRELAPHLCSTVSLNDATYDATRDVVTETQRHYFCRTIEIGEESVVVSHENASIVLAQWLAYRCLPSVSIPTLPNKSLQEVITKNITIQTFANQLNIRAGQTVFKVYSFEELTQRWSVLLVGVAGFGQLPSISALVLPELDPNLIVQVRRNCPDRMRYMTRDVLIEYPGYGSPKIRINETDIGENWLNFIEHPPTLPDGRLADVEIVRVGQPSIKVHWQDGHADLSDIPTYSIRFVQESVLNSYLSRIQQSRTLPWFLPRISSQDIAKLNRKLDQLSTIVLEPLQLKFIQWCIAMQVINQARAECHNSLLTVLAAHPFMKKRDYNSLADVVGSALNSVFNWFGQAQNAAANPQQRDVGDFIQEAIRSIHFL